MPSRPEAFKLQRLGSALFPALDDRALPALVAARAHGVAWLLAECEVPAPVVTVRVLRHHVGSRCALELSGSRGRYVLKAFKRNPAAQVATLRRLVDDGLGNPTGPCVTPVVGHAAALACFVMPWLDGPSGAELLAAGRGDRLGQIAAQWFPAAARIGRGELAVAGAASMLQDLERWVDVIGQTDPGRGRAVTGLVAGLARRLPPDGTAGLLHQSFAASHLVDLGRGPGIIDWDEPAHGPLELDAGSFLASVTRESVAQKAFAPAAARVAERFVEETAGLLDPDALDWYRTAALVKQVKHQCKCRRPGWQRVADSLLAVAG